MRLLILGGYGTFGGRLARLLCDEERLTLLIAGRSRSRATAFCAALPGGAAREAVVFDRDGDVAAQLRRVAPDIVVDASGPFQAYGAAPYRVIEAAIALGISYLDLADATDFVRGIGRFDRASRDRGVFVLCGASSVPVLTMAATRVLARDMRRVDRIVAGIAPSPRAGVGPNVVRSIASYAGRKVMLQRAGRPASAFALTETMRFTVAPPGQLPLGNRLFSLVDVPDLQLLPERWPGLRSAWVGAGPAPELLHRGLNALAWMVRLRLLPSLLPLAGLFHWVTMNLAWGEHRSGMFVLVEGEAAQGGAVARSWHLLAEGEAGPSIPAMAAEAVVRRCLAGERPAPGARPAGDAIELADYQPGFARHGIRCGFRESDPRAADAPLYRRILGAAWDNLPAPIRAMHALRDTMVADGEGSVERGHGLLSRAIAAIFRFPRAGTGIPVTVRFTRDGGAETWERDFAGRRFRSIQSAGKGRDEFLMVERFGPFAFSLALVAEQDRLSLVTRRWSFLGLPLPLGWAPTGLAYESAPDGRFHFHVAIAHPLTGPIVRYSGHLTPRPGLPAP